MAAVAVVVVAAVVAAAGTLNYTNNTHTHADTK